MIVVSIKPHADTVDYFPDCSLTMSDMYIYILPKIKIQSKKNHCLAILLATFFGMVSSVTLSRLSDPLNHLVVVVLTLDTLVATWLEHGRFLGGHCAVESILKLLQSVGRSLNNQQ